MKQCYEHQSLEDRTGRAHWFFFPRWCGQSLLRETGTSVPILLVSRPSNRTLCMDLTLKNIKTRILNSQSLRDGLVQVSHHLGRKANSPRGSHLPKDWAIYIYFFLPKSQSQYYCILSKCYYCGDEPFGSRKEAPQPQTQAKDAEVIGHTYTWVSLLLGPWVSLSICGTFVRLHRSEDPALWPCFHSWSKSLPLSFSYPTPLSWPPHT